MNRTKTPGRGSPQGGVLSPLIWNLVMDSLLTELEKGPIKAVGYADDILLMGTEVVTENVQQGINITKRWG